VILKLRKKILRAYQHWTFSYRIVKKVKYFDPISGSNETIMFGDYAPIHALMQLIILREVRVKYNEEKKKHW
jgi:hypothetical protein